MAKIVIIDDEAPILELMGKLVRTMGHDPFLYQTGREGVDALDRLKPELLIVDLRIGDMNGLQIIQDARVRHPKTAVVMVTGYGTVETAVEAMKLGAFDYLTKPFELEDLKRTIVRAVRREEPVAQERAEPAIRTSDANTVVGESSQIKDVLRVAQKIANNDSPCLLEGEFGSGKQMVARCIHNMSRRANAPFRVLHCSALPEELLELELFGSAAGMTNTIFNRAQGGTVVLEEINYLPQRLQSQLDSFLEDTASQRGSSSNLNRNDFRLIATSSTPLDKLVKEGKFREDLYYRLSVIPVNIPPLRSRKEDIPLLANHFVKNYARVSNSPVCEIDKYAMDLLTNYNWPGNVGELQNAIERACVIAEKNRVRPADLPPKVTNRVEIKEEDTGGRMALPIGTSLSEFIKKQEKLFIRETLKFNEGSREKTATMLGVSIATLYRKMGLKLERDKMLA